MKLFALLMLTALSCPCWSASSLDAHFDSLSTKDKLRFLEKMPKGGELHFHLAGSLSPQKLLALGSDACITRNGFVVSKEKACDYLPLASLKKDSTAYQKVIDTWSFDNYQGSKAKAHDHFFKPFAMFAPLVYKNQADIMVALIKEAFKQNTLYLEVMMTPDNNQALRFGRLVKPNDTPAQAFSRLSQNADFLAHIQQSVKYIARLDKQIARKLNCPRAPACSVVWRYQYYILREQSPSNSLAQATAAFMTAAGSDSTVGINLVQAEDGAKSLKNYQRQMAQIGWLKHHFPSVNASLHAGELSPALVSKKDLRSHIREALLIAGANRIGHGTAIAHEDNFADTLTRMQRLDIPVEVNLTSNKIILNIEKSAHPLRQYLAANVPVVLSTDDKGILDTTLANEYLIAAIDHHLSYGQLKQLSRNALSYSFLKGKSLWHNNLTAQPIARCRPLRLDTLAKACLAFVKGSDKASLQLELERRFKLFEAGIS